MRDLEEIIIHCSASEFGDVKLIDKWHRENGWLGCGYHIIILNGYRKNKSKYNEKEDGLIENGRPLESQGAHCLGHNKYSIGVCLIGLGKYSEKQFDTLEILLRELKNKYEIKKVVGHNYYDTTRLCPAFDWRKYLIDRELS